MNTIPVIGTAIVNTTSWLERLINSVNYPTEHFVIINNNGRGQLTDEINQLCSKPNPYIKNFYPVHMPSNNGCAGAWNTIIKSFIKSPYWIIVNHDIEFPDKFLEKMVHLASDETFGTVHGHLGPTHFMGGFSLFLIRDWVVRDFGLFDENFYPGYSEDLDYEMRFINKPIKRHYSVGIPYKHGDTYEYGVSGSQTWRKEPELKEKIDKGRIINEYEYMTKKWGEGWRMCSPYKTPFNNPSFPQSYWTYDLEFCRRKHLGF